MLHLGVREQVFEEVERGAIQPLQIVKEQNQRVLLPRKDAEKTAENHLEAVLRISRREVRNGRLLPDDELQIWNEADHQLAVRAEGLPQRRTPPAHLRFWLDQNLADQ